MRILDAVTARGVLVHGLEEGWVVHIPAKREALHLSSSAIVSAPAEMTLQLLAFRSEQGVVGRRLRMFLFGDGWSLVAHMGRAWNALLSILTRMLALFFKLY